MYRKHMKCGQCEICTSKGKCSFEDIIAAPFSFFSSVPYLVCNIKEKVFRQLGSLLRSAMINNAFLCIYKKNIPGISVYTGEMLF